MQLRIHEHISSYNDNRKMITEIYNLFFVLRINFTAAIKGINYANICYRRLISFILCESAFLSVNMRGI